MTTDLDAAIKYFSNLPPVAHTTHSIHLFALIKAAKAYRAQQQSYGTASKAHVKLVAEVQLLSGIMATEYNKPRLEGVGEHRDYTLSELADYFESIGDELIVTSKGYEEIAATGKFYSMLEPSSDEQQCEHKDACGHHKEIADFQCPCQQQTQGEDAYALVQKQAEDEGLWFIARTAPEAYLQQELRKLHDVIEKSHPAPSQGAEFPSIEELEMVYTDGCAFPEKVTDYASSPVVRRGLHYVLEFLKSRLNFTAAPENKGEI